jgi:5,10-methylenetetrahydrofolate reductase
MSPVVTAHLVRQHTGLDVIAHLTCRDRNVLALQAELLGAHALGVRHVLCLRGDPPTRGDHPDATGVFEVGALELAALVSGLNAGVSFAGRDLGSRTDFRVGVALNPTGADLTVEAQRMAEKVAAGADFAQTQPVFSRDDVLRFLDAVGTPAIPVLYGVLPLRSVKMAQNVQKWARVPDALLRAVEDGGARAGVAWSAKLVADLADLGVDGVHLYPLGKPAVVAEVLGRTARPDAVEAVSVPTP